MHIPLRQNHGHGKLTKSKALDYDSHVVDHFDDIKVDGGEVNWDVEVNDEKVDDVEVNDDDEKRMLIL